MLSAFLRKSILYPSQFTGSPAVMDITEPVIKREEILIFKDDFIHPNTMYSDIRAGTFRGKA